MKKLLPLFFIFAIALTGCAQISAFFATLTANRTEGTAEDKFTFSVDTNDVITGWYIDGVETTPTARAAESEDFTFSEGDHTVTVETENCQPASVYIHVSAVENTEKTLFFTVNLVSYNGISPVSYLSPVLTYGIVDFNLQTMEPDGDGPQVIATDTADGRLITITMGAYDWLISEMAAYPHAGLTETEFTDYLATLYSTTEPAQSYAYTVFSISATTSSIPNTFSVTDTAVKISGISIPFDDIPATIENNVRTLNISLNVDSSDATLFYGDNMINFFGMDYTDLSLEELKTVAEIILRYPEENILVLSGELGK